ITPRLLEVATGETVATGKVDGNWEELFALQDRVVSNLLAALQVEADTSALERIAPPETRQLEAYEHYAQGRKKLDELGKNSLEEARQQFERAVALDSGYAMAYSGLGATHAMRFVHRTDPDDLACACGYLERALELDPELGEPYPWLCYIYVRQGKLDQAVSAGRKGVERQPDLDKAHYFLGIAYSVSAELNPDSYQRAVECLLHASALEPCSEGTWLGLGTIALAVGNYDCAEKFSLQALELERSGTSVRRFVGAETLLGSVWLRRGQWEKARQFYLQALESLATSDHMYRDAFVALTACGLGDLHLRQGQADAALADFRRAWRTVKEFPRMLGNERVLTRTLAGMVCAYAAQGERERAAQLAREAGERLNQLSRQPQSFIWEATTSQLYYALAVAHRRLGDTRAALDLLEKAVEKGWRDPHWLGADPEMATLLEQPRFQSLLENLRQTSPVHFTATKAVA
ncbi:MAG: tetratricopeptide repeat protein, partial [Terriglobia bacterium]